MSELKKCPFCGGEARLEGEPIGKGEFLYYVSCVNDRCITQNVYYTKKEGAIKAWNTRKPVETLVDGLGMRKEKTKKNVFVEEHSFLGAIIEIIKEEVEL